MSAEVQAVVSGDGPFDVLTTENNHTNAKVRWNEETLAGGTPAQQPDAWNEITVSRHVSGKLPPFFIWHGEKDDVIPVAGTIHFVDALKKAGVPVEFIIVKNGGHTAFYPVDKTQPIVPDGKTLIAKTEAFLKQYLVVPGK